MAVRTWLNVFALLPGRPPAHRVEHVQAVLRRISTEPGAEGTALGHVELRSLLRSGIALDLGAGLERIVGALKPESPFVGKPATLGSFAVDGERMHFLALNRASRLLLPGTDRDTTLAAGDELLLAASADSIKPFCERVGLSPR